MEVFKSTLLIPVIFDKDCASLVIILMRTLLLITVVFENKPDKRTNRFKIVQGLLSKLCTDLNLLSVPERFGHGDWREAQ